MEMYMKTCNLCNKPLRGRTDKKYCSELCRNNYNNQLRAAGTNLMRNINHALARNRRILHEVFGESNTVIKTSKEELLMNGFQWRYFTHMEENRKGINYTFCYDYGYRVVNENCLLIVKTKTADPKSGNSEEIPEPFLVQ